MKDNWKKLNILEYKYDDGENTFYIINSYGYWYVSDISKTWFTEVENVKEGKELVEKLLK